MSTQQTVTEKFKQNLAQQSSTGLANSHPLRPAPALQRYATLPQISAPKLSPSLSQISQDHGYDTPYGRTTGRAQARGQNLPTLIELLKGTFSAATQSGSPTFTSLAGYGTTIPHRDPDIRRHHTADQPSPDLRCPRDASLAQERISALEPQFSTAFPQAKPSNSDHRTTNSTVQLSRPGGDSSKKIRDPPQVHKNTAALDGEHQAQYPPTMQSSSVQATQGRTRSYDRPFPIQEDPDDDSLLVVKNDVQKHPEHPENRHRTSSQLPGLRSKGKSQHFEPRRLKFSVRESYLVDSEYAGTKTVRPKHSRPGAPSPPSSLPPDVYTLDGGEYDAPISIAQVTEYYPHPFEHIRRNATLSPNVHPYMFETPDPNANINAPQDDWKIVAQNVQDAYESGNTSDSTFSAPVTPFQDNSVPWARWRAQRSLKRTPDSRSIQSNPDHSHRNPAPTFRRKKHRADRLGTRVSMKVLRLRGSQPRNSSPEPPSSDEESNCLCDEHDERAWEEERERESEGQEEQVTEHDRLLGRFSQLLENSGRRKALQGLEGDDAQLMIDYTHAVLLRPDLPAWLRKHSRIVLYRLCSALMLYPQCYVLKGITKDSSPEGGGGFADVYKGRLGDKKLCLKVVRLSKKSDVIPALKALAKEGIVWGQLIHPHILPFYGIYYLEETYEQICLVSPWMNNSDLGTYLKKNPTVPRTPFIHDIAKGLEYLHHEDVIHGDMKAANVLVSDSGKACITDFGLSSIPTDQTLAYSRGATTVVGCSFRWAAPELLEEGCRATPASDVWAFGCVCCEILFGELPFCKCNNNVQVIRMLDKGASPFEPRPEIPFPEIDADSWKLMESCCAREPKDRPSSLILSQGLRRFSKVSEDIPHQAAPEGLEFQNEVRSKEGVSIDLERVEQVLDKLEAPLT